MNIKKIVISSVVFFTIGIFWLALPAISHGAGIKDTLLSPNGEFKKATSETSESQTSVHPATILIKVIKVALTFLGIIVVAMFIWAGYLYMTASGKSENVETAQQILLYAVIGAIIVIAALGLTVFVFDTILNNVLAV